MHSDDNKNGHTGNKKSKTSYDTSYMWHVLTKDQFPGASDAEFLPLQMRDYFNTLLYEHGVTNSNALLEKAEIQSSYGHEILSGKKQAAPGYYVQIALALGLDLRETQRMLAVSRRGCLHPRIRSDAAAIFAINHGYSVKEYRAFFKALGERVPPTNDELDKMEIPDTTVMWELLAGDAFPDAGYLLEDAGVFFDNLLKALGVEKSALNDETLIQRIYFYQILNGAVGANKRRIKATRDYYIRIALGLGIDVRTTQRMLAVTKRGCLHPLVKRDAAVIYAIEHRFTYSETVDFLAKQKLPRLDSAEKNMKGPNEAPRKDGA